VILGISCKKNPVEKEMEEEEKKCIKEEKWCIYYLRE
jgi:hypothetical protein